MISIQVKGEFLDLPSGVNLKIKLRNPVYTSGDFKIVDGSFSIPITVDVTDQIKRIADHPQRLDAAGPLLQDEPCTLYIQGVPVFRGELTINQTTRFTARLYIVINALGALKDQSLRDIDYGGIRNFEGLLGNSSRATYAKTTATSVGSQAYDHIFFPVYNPRLWSEVPEEVTRPAHHEFQNRYDPAANGGQGLFTQGADDLNITPFPKLRSVLSYIFQQFGVSVNNVFADSHPHLNDICLYNTRTISDAEGNWMDWNYADHLPDIKAADLIKAVMQWNIGIGYNAFTEEVDIVPLIDILQKQPTHDWTRKSAYDYQKVPITQKAYRVFYPYDQDYLYIGRRRHVLNRQFVDLPSELIDYEIDFLSELQQFIFENSADFDKEILYVYVRNSDLVVRLEHDLNGDFTQSYFNNIASPAIEVGTASDEDEVEMGLRPLIDYLEQQQPRIPEAQLLGYLPFLEDSSDPDIELWITSYRGFVNDRPTANMTMIDSVYDGSFTPPFSLNTLEPNSVPRHYWNRWLNILQNSYEVTRKVALTLPDILNFKFTDTVRIESLHYLVTEMDIEINQNGIQPSTVKMIRL